MLWGSIILYVVIVRNPKIVLLVTVCTFTRRSRSSQDPNIIFDGEPFIGFQAPCREQQGFGKQISGQACKLSSSKKRQREVVSRKLRCAGLPG